MNINPAFDVNEMHYYYPACLPMPELAHAYVPFQYFTCIYPPMKGLEQGTIFPDLDSHYGCNPEYPANA